MNMDRPWDVDRPILIDGSSWTSWPPLCGALALLCLWIMAIVVSEFFLGIGSTLSSLE